MPLCRFAAQVKASQRHPPQSFCHASSVHFTSSRPACPQFGQKVEVAQLGGGTRLVPNLDLGVGLSFELDTAELQPQARAVGGILSWLFGCCMAAGREWFWGCV